MMSPVIILVEPQLAENIGMAARAMANFGLEEMRIVLPLEGWPERGHMKKGAVQAASGAGHILEEARLFETLEEAVADCHALYATTARERGQMKRVLGPQEAMQDIAGRSSGQRTGILFGRERTGLSNDEVALADAIITFPVNPNFPSLNLAQAVLLTGYEWRKTQNHPLPFSGEAQSQPASRAAMISMFEYLEQALDDAGHYPEGKKPVMVRNMRDILLRLNMSEQELRTLRGAFAALEGGRRKREAL